jgi:hypothetical protein
MFFRQRVKAFAHVAELPRFTQNRTGMHWIRKLPENSGKESFRQADVVRGV